MRGGAQAHLMLCSDGHYYVVKFFNNPQHSRVLVNEMLATRLAETIGLPVPSTAIVQVDDCLVASTPQLQIQLAHNVVPCQAGLQFGSKYVVDPLEGQVFDYLPDGALRMVRNLEAFAGMLALDKWTGNTDGRQAAFWRKSRERKYSASFIDQGHCFNLGDWTFPDFPLRGIYSLNDVYDSVRDWESFEPWLSRIERMPEEAIWHIASEIPTHWYGEKKNGLDLLVRSLIARRGIVRDLIEKFRVSTRRPFQGWVEHSNSGASAAI